MECAWKHIGPIDTIISHSLSNTALGYWYAMKIRYRQTDQACVIYSGPDDTLRVEFESPQRAITPGQSAVFYDADRCLGGGVIECAL